MRSPDVRASGTQDLRQRKLTVPLQLQLTQWGRSVGHT